MSLALTDIPAAIEEYLRENVAVAVSPVIPDDPAQDVLTPGQFAHFTITATNGAGAAGVRLTNLLYHVEVDHPKTIKLLAPGQLMVVAFADPDKDSPITHDTAVDEMYIENTLETTLGAGDVGTQLNVKVRCVDQGQVTITVRVRADVDTDDLFRTGHSMGRQRTADVE